MSKTKLYSKQNKTYFKNYINQNFLKQPNKHQLFSVNNKVFLYNNLLDLNSMYKKQTKKLHLKKKHLFFLQHKTGPTLLFSNWFAKRGLQLKIYLQFKNVYVNFLRQKIIANFILDSRETVTPFMLYTPQTFTFWDLLKFHPLAFHLDYSLNWRGSTFYTLFRLDSLKFKKLKQKSLWLRYVEPHKRILVTWRWIFLFMAVSLPYNFLIKNKFIWLINNFLLIDNITTKLAVFKYKTYRIYLLKT